MPKFIVDIYAEGESDIWCENFINEQLDIISAGYVKVEKFTSTNSDYAAAARVICEWQMAVANKETILDIYNWNLSRLNTRGPVRRQRPASIKNAN